MYQIMLNKQALEKVLRNLIKENYKKLSKIGVLKILRDCDKDHIFCIRDLISFYNEHESILIKKEFKKFMKKFHYYPISSFFKNDLNIDLNYKYKHYCK